MDPVSRREAAWLLGFASDFKVRQLEQQGRLHAVRGAMGQAWYARQQVLALAGPMPPPIPADSAGRRDGGVGAIRPGPAAVEVALRRTVSAGLVRWSDAALLARLRMGCATTESGLPTVVDLVVDTGISIARAEKVFRFWLTHDAHPTAAVVRRARGVRSLPEQQLAAVPGDTDAKAENHRGAVSDDGGVPTGSSPYERPAPPVDGERRAAIRLDRDSLIRELRDPDPQRRALAFRKLRHLPRAGRRGDEVSPDD